MEDILKSTTAPHYDGEVDYGDRAEHCWNGDHTQPNAIVACATFTAVCSQNKEGSGDRGA